MAQLYKRTIIKPSESIEWPQIIFNETISPTILVGYKYAIELMHSGDIVSITNNLINETTFEVAVLFISKKALELYVANSLSLQNIYANYDVQNPEWVAYCTTNKILITYTIGDLEVSSAIKTEDVSADLLQGLVTQYLP